MKLTRGMKSVKINTNPDLSYIRTDELTEIGGRRSFW